MEVFSEAGSGHLPEEQTASYWLIDDANTASKAVSLEKYR
jgi:hypothetical protein